MKNLDKI